MDTREVLVEGRRRLAEGGWVQNMLQDGWGAYCAAGAVSWDAAPQDYEPAISALAEVLHERGVEPSYGGHDIHDWATVVTFNNEVARAVDEVLEVFDEAIARAS